jgi:hypothetical protein
VDETYCKIAIRRIRHAMKLRKTHENLLQLEYWDYSLTWLKTMPDDAPIRDLLTGKNMEPGDMIGDDLLLTDRPPVYREGEDDYLAIEAVTRMDQYDGECLWEGLITNTDQRVETASVSLDVWKTILKMFTKGHS